MNRSALVIREADLNDAPYCAQACVRIVQYLQQNVPHDVYTAALPGTVGAPTLAWVKGFIENPRSIALLAEIEDAPAGCLLATISETNMPATGFGEVGHIAGCWVEPAYRNHGIASDLVEHAEHWFRQQRVSRVELSYMAGNTVAQKAWTHLGYLPFRIFAHKEI
ncbi:MAG: GNAT family N-acetyltransferase [Pseudomonadota bacterium]|nr:GNAT family N-acetyltransferase [Pseudomonadota bacterium]